MKYYCIRYFIRIVKHRDEYTTWARPTQNGTTESDILDSLKQIRRGNYFIIG